MKHIKYLIVALALGLLSPALRAQQDQPASRPQTPKSENVDPGRREAQAKNLLKQLQRKQAAGQELTAGEVRQLRELETKLSDQRQPKKLEQKAAAVEKKVRDK